tara:strand:- start:2200 stop:2424 length:225 start_codon:yes stop_codon:yes gene_type:complete
MSWLYSLLLLPLLPFAFVGYYKLAKDGLKNEIQEQINTIEEKEIFNEEVTDKEREFLKSAKLYIKSLNNLEKND